MAELPEPRGRSYDRHPAWQPAGEGQNGGVLEGGLNHLFSRRRKDWWVFIGSKERSPMLRRPLSS